MTNDTVTLCTERTSFAPLWRETLEQHGFKVRVCAPTDLASTPVRDTAVIFDASDESYDDDDLLTAVGFVRAAGGHPVVHTEEEIEEVVEEVCLGRVSRSSDDIERLVAVLARQMDGERGRRFEFVTVSPRDDEVLAILGDGTASLLKRPIHKSDDRTEVVAITLADDAASVSLELASGVTFELRATAISRRSQGNGAPIDGSRLGARLRALRLEAGLTQAELARRTGIHRPNIARVEAGRHTPSLETLARLATAIGVPTTRVLAED